MTTSESSAGRESISTHCRLCGLLIQDKDGPPWIRSLRDDRLYVLFDHWWLQHGLRGLNAGRGDAAFMSEISLGIHNSSGAGFTCPVCGDLVPGSGLRTLCIWLGHIHDEHVDFEQHMTYMLLCGAC